MARAEANDRRVRHWSREPLVWMLIAIPLSSVVMGAVLISLAVGSDDGLVADDYYRRGLEINRSLDRDRAAAELGVNGRLELSPAGSTLVLGAAPGGDVLPAAVVLRLSHATRAGLDRELEFMRLSPGDYAAPSVVLPPGRWYAEISGGRWRLTGSFSTPGATALELRPRAAQPR